ncbi:MAG: hypothetical protein E6J33_08910 [Chloroflexi bacterium]|nr:MAG: hypothetical protein E6J33_08910 [Chloroflexota bacterium]
MQNIITRKHSLVITAIVVLLSIQGILGLLFSLSRLAGLLAPRGSIIVSGVSIFFGPAGGVSLVVALASPIIAWGFWMLKPWAHQRAVLIEVVSLVIAGFELIDPVVNIGVPAARIIIAALILICLYAGSGVRALSRA